MRNLILLVAAVCCLTLSVISQTPRNGHASPVLATRLSHADNDIFIYLGKRDNVMHLVWDEVTQDNIAYYVVMQSKDGKKFHALDSIQQGTHYDIYANDYPDHIRYENTILYSTETGNGRFIYNDVLTATEMQEVMLWYRIKIVTTQGYDIYTKKMQKAVNTRANPINGGLQPTLRQGAGNLPSQFSGSGTHGTPGGNYGNPNVAYRMTGCPPVQTPPVDYVYTGNYQIYYGECCYWEEREYRQSLITAPCGDINAWCCPNTGDCQPLAYDPCCVHVCSEYNQCSCHPWTCCDISNTTIWIVYASTDYTFDATITAIDDASCNGFFDGSATLTYNSGLPFIPLLSWDNGVRTGNILNNLEAGIYSLTISDATSCSETLTFTISEPPVLESSVSVQNVTCFGLNDGIVDVSVSGGTPPYTYSWLNGSTPLPDLTQDLVGVGGGNYAVTVTDANGCVSNEFYPVQEPDDFTGVIRLEDLSCPIAGTAVLDLCCYGTNTGSAVLQLSGGTPPARFVWSDGSTGNEFRNLTAGSYSVTAYDANGCSFSRNFTLGERPEIVLTATSTNAACGQCNGSATVDVTGGSGGFSWQWPPSAGNQTTRTATNLCAGSYTVLVSDLFAINCYKTITVSVSNTGGETITTSKTDASCFGVCDGTASVSFTCSDPPCSVQWYDPSGTPLSTANSVGNLCGGSHSVVVTNASGCVTSETVEIEQNATIESNLSIINETCDGACDGLATAAPIGGTSPYTYQWLDGTGTAIPGADNNLLTDLCSGDYTLVVSDAAGCSASFPFTISSLNNLFATTTVTQYLCYNDCSGSISALAAGGSPPYSFQWFENGQPLAEETNFNINNRCAGTYTLQVTDANGCSYTTPDIFISEPAELTASITATTDLTCTSVCSGSASVTGAGGSGILSYKWYNSFAVEIAGETNAAISNLCAGNYFAEVTDTNGCSSGLLPFTINDINPLTASISTTNVSCNGAADGTIDLTVSGGFPPYTFLWGGGETSEDLSGLSAGTFTVTITDSSGCSITASATVAEPDPVVTIITAKTYGAGGYNISCYGATDGQLTAEVSGGTPPYSYQWDDPNAQIGSAAIGLGLGTYSVTVTDINGCSASETATISLEPGPFTSFVTAFVYPTGFNVSCFGASDGSIDLTVNGGEPPFIFAWTYNGAADAYLVEDPTGVPAGTYTVNVVDTSLGCITRDTIVLSEPSEIILSLTPSIYPGGVNISTAGGSDGSIDLEVSGGVAPYSYLWSNGETTEDIDSLTAGTYSCTVTDFSGCTVAASIVLREPVPSLEVIDTTICEGTCVFAAGECQTSSGTYIDSFLNSFGLDSVIITNLTVLPASRTSLEVIICQGQSYFAGGADQTQSGVYYDTLVAANGCDSIVSTMLDVVSVISLTFDVVDAGCDASCDGSATVIATGGNLPYTISWSNGATTADLTSLCPGTYYVTVTDADGCQATGSVTVAGGQPVSVSITSTNNTCNCPDPDICCEGTASASVTGGAEPYSFAWSNGATTADISQLCAGTYNVTVTDANGCFSTASVTIHGYQPIELTVTTQGLSEQCGGNRMCELNFGDFPPGTILNEQYAAYGIHISGNAFGTYPDQVVIYNADGNGPDPDLQTASGHLAIFPENVTDADGNGTVDVPNDQGRGGLLTITFDYDRTVTSFLFVDKENNNPGTATAYDANNNLITSVAIPNAGNGSLQTIVMNATGVRKIVFDYRDSGGLTDILLDCNPRCCDGSATATVTGGTPPFTYLWSNGETTATITGLCPGDYSVTVTDADGCTSTQTTTIDDCALTVSSLTIVREHFGGDVALFTEGMTISLDTLCPFNIRANLCQEPVGSVKFILNGNDFRVEEYIPYALAGDNPTGDYHDWVSTPGSYTLEVIPYSEPRARGTAGETFTATFTVVGQTCNTGARLASSVMNLSNGVLMEVFPVPFNDQLVISMNATNSSNGKLRMVDLLGRELISRDIDVTIGKNTMTLDMSNTPEAVYFLEVRLGNYVNTMKVVKAN